MICQSACSSWQPGDVVVVEVGVAADQLGEGRHGRKTRRRDPDWAPGHSALAGWAPCLGSYWKQVHADDFRVPRTVRWPT